MAAYRPGFFDEVFQSWDMAFKKSGTSRVCGLVMAYKRDPSTPVDVNPWGDVYVLDCIAEHMSFVESVAAVTMMSERHPAAFTKVVESAANGEAIMSLLASKVGGFLPWPPPGQAKQAKEECWNAASPPQRGGQCHLPADAAWVPEFRRNMGHLPLGTPNDEGDAFAQGCDYIRQQAGFSLERLSAW